MSQIDEMLAEIEARVKAQEARAKHWDGEHHIGCGYGVSVCPGEPDWSFARTDIPRLVAALREMEHGLRVITAGSDAMADCAAHYIARAEAALRGEE